jgi:hypothetical protein
MHIDLPKEPSHKMIFKYLSKNKTIHGKNRQYTLNDIKKGIQIEALMPLRAKYRIIGFYLFHE